jgi:hypothetical protein
MTDEINTTTETQTETSATEPATETAKRIHRTPKEKGAFFAAKATHYLKALANLGVPELDLEDAIGDVDAAADDVQALPDNWKIRVPKAPVAKKRPVVGDAVEVKEAAVSEYPGIDLAGLKVEALAKKTATCKNAAGQIIALPKKHLQKVAPKVA